MKQKGFTLLEILLVIAAIGILAAIVIVAINPNRQLAQVRNSTRFSDVNAISKALDQYLIDQGEYPADLTDTYEPVCTEDQVTLGDTSSCTDLSSLVPTYLASIDQDPSGESYSVAINPKNDKVSVIASAELDESISINEFVMAATGGTETLVLENDIYYRLHTFDAVGSDSLTILEDVDIDYLIVAGGGGSRNAENNLNGDGAGGGGGGGVLSGSTTITTGSYPVVVGDGGDLNDTTGENSTFNGLTAIGGGRGGGMRNNNVTSGGSGGGAGGNCAQPNRTGGAGTLGQGFAGGNDAAPPTGCVLRGGRGGGGSGEAAPSANSSSGTRGGDGIINTITGANVYYGGGGGGGRGAANTIGGNGGLGGGGNGSDGTTPAQNGTPNTGGGGGGGASGLSTGGTGGSGIIHIRYEI